MTSERHSLSLSLSLSLFLASPNIICIGSRSAPEAIIVVTPRLSACLSIDIHHYAVEGIRASAAARETQPRPQATFNGIHHENEK